MVRLAVVQHDVVLVWRNPGAQWVDREILAKGVLIRQRTAAFSGAHRPAVDLVAARDDTIIAGRGDHFGVWWRQWHAFFGDVIRGGYLFPP